MPIPRAIRLYFKHTEKGLELVRSRGLNMRAPDVLDRKALEEREDAYASVGYWLDIMDEKGDTLFRRAVPELGRERLEAYTGDEKQPFVVSEKRGPDYLTVVVPDVPEARSLKIRQQFVELPKQAVELSKKGKSGSQVSSRDLFEVDLRKLSEQGGEK